MNSSRPSKPPTHGVSRNELSHFELTSCLMKTSMSLTTEGVDSHAEGPQVQPRLPKPKVFLALTISFNILACSVVPNAP